jgi:hypothetical protein
MSPYLSAARSILAISKDESSWDFIKEGHDSFIWTDDDTVEQWNRIAAKLKLLKVKQRIDTSAKEEREFLTYKDKTVEVPLIPSRDDREIVIHTLGRLVRADSDIRFCLDSFHSSDLAFLALLPADWKALEKEFGRKAVAYRFLAFPEKLEDFLDQAFSEKNNREYASDIPDTSAEKQMAQELAKYIKELVKPYCPSVDVACDLELASARVLRIDIKTRTDDERDSLSKDHKRHKQIVDTAKKRCAEHEITLTMAYVQSHESINRDWAGDWTYGLIAGYSIYSWAAKE